MKLVLLKKADLPLEVVILLIGSMTMMITGILLFPVSEGSLPYYENGLYGLLLVIFALQIITLGKPPFGEMGRSGVLLVAGVMIAAAGMVTCFIPIFKQLPRILLFLCFGPGGFLLLIQMCFLRDKLRTWVKYGGIFWHLISGCSAVYVLSILIALFLWKQNPNTIPMAAVVILIYGLAIFYLACVIHKIYRKYPEAEKPAGKDIEFSTDQAMLLLIGVFMLLLGLLLIPVNLGFLPFSKNAQLGLLMVIFAVQMLAAGSTPIGVFPRSWPVIIGGILFAAIGIVSCIIPEILVAQLTVLVGVLNILGGIITLVKICLSRKTPSEVPPAPASSVVAKLFTVNLTMNLLQILFGTSMLMPNLVPGLIIGVILAANGCVLLYLLHILIVLDIIKRNITAGTCN